MGRSDLERGTYTEKMIRSVHLARSSALRVSKKVSEIFMKEQ